ncbi:MAG: right-handed parallel beta-helix repeat-containing protein [Clostridia bacterium]|nr:right-handed parallel beta-helix repeat-containing protein [Clostridia bacterium]
MKKLLSLILSAVLLFPLAVCFSAFAAGNEIFVAPNGSDSNDGSFSSPLATLEAAKEKAKTTGADTVYFREGSYTIQDTVRFDQTDRPNVTYKAYNGEHVTFTAGVPYTGFEPCTVNGVQALRKFVGKQADFNILFNAQTTLPRTRYPASGYLMIHGVDDRYCINPDLQVDANFHKGYTALIADKNDIPAMQNIGDVVVRVLHFWKDEMLRVKSYDPATGVLEFTKPSAMTFHENERFFLENVFEALDTPGEWYLDKPNGLLYYIPLPGETADSVTLWGGETETLLSIDGVDGIRFERIVFRGNGFNIPEGRDFSQAAYNAPGCIVCENAKGFALQNCEFRDIAACAVFLGENVKESSVDSCLFCNIGAQAVYIRGQNVPVDDPSVTKQITVRNNLVNGYGRVFFNAVGVLIIHANSVDVLNNEIHDGYYTAISVGWSWGYNYSVTYNNHICDNLIYDIGQGWLSDMGGIYTLGLQPGTVLSGNCIHNVAADPGEGGYGGWGIYPDEGSSNMLIEKNLVFACGNDSYHLHYGENNTVRNNIFALSGESQVRVVSRAEGRLTARFTDNILLTDGKAATFSHMQGKDLFEAKHNFLWDLTCGDELYVNQNGDANRSMTVRRAEKKGWLKDCVIVDPKFRDAANFDFTLAEDSPVLQQGFEAWDYTTAGTVAGTVVGLDHAGGQTPYNANAKAQTYTESFTVWTRIIRFFRNLSEQIRVLFTR